MRLDKLTIKAQEALQAAQSLADQHEHQAVEPEHLLAALLQQREGVVAPVLGKLGVRAETLQQQLEAEVAKLPQVRGGGSGRARSRPSWRACPRCGAAEAAASPWASACAPRSTAPSARPSG